MSGFVKGFISGILTSILIFSILKFFLSFLGIFFVLLLIYAISGVNLITLPNILVIWVFWKLFFRRKSK